LYKKDEVDEVYIASTIFKSALSQEVEILKLIPLVFEKDTDEQGMAGKEEKQNRSKVQYITSAEAGLSYIVPKFISGKVYGGILECFAAEPGASRTGLESATGKANEMLSQLGLS
ncbi:F0F1 ATP synthase subunit gamma, partial [Clostridioides difficile]